MKSKYILLGLLLPVLNGNAQTTFETPYSSNASGMYNPSATFFDADNDGDLDVVYNGANLTEGTLSKLMLNNGTGQFTESVQPFIQVYSGKVISGDINGDGDIDVFIAGAGSDFLSYSGLYNNDGTGVFTENTSTSIFSFQAGDAAFFDSDGDADLDLILTGANTTDTLIETRLYVNDGSGNFTFSPTSIDNTGFAYSSLLIGDVDGDGDKDVFICGQTYVGLTEGPVESKLYLNNGNNNFTVSAQSFTGNVGAAVLFDIDNDSDLDIVLNGTTDGSSYFCKVALNNGSGIFTESNSSIIPGLFSSFMKAVDADNDGDKDLFLAGGDASVMFKYYDNQGGNFVEMTGQPFFGFNAGTIEAADINGDGFVDIYATGSTDLGGNTSVGFYLNRANVGVNTFDLVDFTVSPNPIQHNQLTFSTENMGFDGDYAIEVRDVQGRRVYYSEASQSWLNQVSIDLNSAETGSYFLILTSGKKEYKSTFNIFKN